MLNYRPLTQQQYVDLLLSTISSLEGHAATRYQNPGDHTTIGYGYTFFRNNNLAFWQTSGIALTSAEVTPFNLLAAFRMERQLNCSGRRILSTKGRQTHYLCRSPEVS